MAKAYSYGLYDCISSPDMISKKRQVFLGGGGGGGGVIAKNTEKPTVDLVEMMLAIADRYSWLSLSRHHKINSKPFDEKS